ncbi:MAG: hypothetical protein IKG87_10755 [Clostridia bacterium]|nr:hypothetical protein [Clostridia bacterium]MBR4577778.1 hypothetical protein [Clostridia bacterium]
MDCEPNSRHLNDEPNADSSEQGESSLTLIGIDDFYDLLMEQQEQM